MSNVTLLRQEDNGVDRFGWGDDELSLGCIALAMPMVSPDSHIQFAVGMWCSGEGSSPAMQVWDTGNAVIASWESVKSGQEAPGECSVTSEVAWYREQHSMSLSLPEPQFPPLSRYLLTGWL